MHSSIIKIIQFYFKIYYSTIKIYNKLDVVKGLLGHCVLNRNHVPNHEIKSENGGGHIVKVFLK